MGINTKTALLVPKNWKPVYSGKVRDIYELDAKTWALVASDRISAFDWILPDYIEDKGKILNQLSRYWFKRLESLVPNHCLPEQKAQEMPADLTRRTMIVKKVNIYPFEFIVRGCLAGSAWKSYQKDRRVGADHQLAPGLKRGHKLSEPLLTPTTKAREKGVHDEEVSWWTVQQSLGKEKAAHIRGIAIEIFKEAAKHLEERGLILVDTKFELGEDDRGVSVLADEVLTPDSSRFWWRKDWQANQQDGKDELPALDKQLVRDYLDKTLSWNKKPPIPILPPPLIEKTRAAYIELFRVVTGKEPDL